MRVHPLLKVQRTEATGSHNEIALKTHNEAIDFMLSDGREAVTHCGDQVATKVELCPLRGAINR